MGFGNGMSIGWPMTSSSRGAKLGWFTILADCKGKQYSNIYSQQLLSTDYKEGDYVFVNDFNIRGLLGPFVEVLPDSPELKQLSGPAYTSCPIYKVFSIDEFCNGSEAYGCTIQIDATYYNTGDYVYSPSLDTRVKLGLIVTPEVGCIENIPVEGPKYNSCTEGLVRYQIIQGCNQGIPDGAATQLVNSNLYTYGDYVYSPIFDTRVTLGSVTESFEAEYQIQGPAFSGCE
jgi:hypothetical protein